MGLKDK